LSFEFKSLDRFRGILSSTQRSVAHSNPLLA
jgi:hypothetical protein